MISDVEFTTINSNIPSNGHP